MLFLSTPTAHVEIYSRIWDCCEREKGREREREIISLITVSSFKIAIGPRLFSFFLALRLDGREKKKKGFKGA